MNKIGYRFLILLALFIGFYLFLAAHPAAAAGSRWVRWKIEVTYPNDILDVQLIVQKGITTQSGVHKIVDEKSYSLPCQPQGQSQSKPIISGGQAVFDGNSYFQCDVPSIQDIAWAEWQMNIPDFSLAKRPYVKGEGTIEGNPIDPIPDNPVFYRDDIQFNIPLDITTQEANLTMTFGQATAESSNFLITSVDQEFTGYIARSDPATFSPFFVVDGLSLSPTPAVITQSMVISNLATTIYIGYSPASGKYFQGTLGPLDIDPVCPTTG